MSRFLAWVPGPAELIVVGVVAVLLFGHRLPQVARSIGGSFVAFKRGLTEGADELEDVKRELDETGKDIGDSIRRG